MVGMSLFEAKLAAMSKLGLYELKFTSADLRDMIVILNPFEYYREWDENVVLMDDFPYVPVVNLPENNSTVVLSNLVLEEKLNPDLVKVDFVSDYQSLYFVDIQVNATFDWKVNGTKMGGQAKVIIPQAWVHQNIEIACSHEQPSILVWEGRVDFYPKDIKIMTTVENKVLIDELAFSLYKSPAMRKYIANAMQHQLAAAIGKVHWKLQERMREDCLQCHGMRYNPSLLEVLIKGDMRCIGALPSYMIEAVYDENAHPQELQEIAPAAIKRGLLASRPTKPKDERLEGQGLPAISTELKETDQLRPKRDWREKFRHKKREGFIEEPTATNPWLQKLGQMWMSWKGKKADETATAAHADTNSTFTTGNMPVSVDGHDKLRQLVP
jgi:hypothetical protein